MDNKANILDELQKLATGHDRPVAKRLREIHPQIEAALSAGASRKQVHQKLVESGYDLTYGSFLVTLSRLRKETRKEIKPPPPVAVAQPPPPASPQSNPLKALASQRKPGGFDPVPSTSFELDPKPK